MKATTKYKEDSISLRKTNYNYLYFVTFSAVNGN